MSVVALQPVTHIPAPAVNVFGRLIQRCAVCGMVLIDQQYNPGTDKPLPEEVLVRVSDEGVETAPFEYPLPDDFCLRSRGDC